MISQILVLLVLPAIILRLIKRFPILKGIGAITICYALGFICAISPIKYDKDFSLTLASIVVALAIPLVLFSFDINSVKKLAKNTSISFCLMIISVMLIAGLVAVIGNKLGMEGTPALSAMATGLYIGGTPNLFAIGSAMLGKDSTLINLANIADSIIGGIYFFLVVTGIKKIYKKVLGSGASKSLDEKETLEYESLSESEYDYSVIDLKNKKKLGKLALTLLLAVLCLGVGAGIEILINGNLDGSLFIIITVSVLGILFSFIKPVRETEGTYQIGQYLILVFSLGLSMSIDLGKLALGLLPTFIYFTSIQIASLLLHFVLCKVFKIDGGTALVTGIAAIYGPPFIAPVANAYGDRSLIVPGVICGTIGLVVGNLLGLGMGTILANIF